MSKENENMNLEQVSGGTVGEFDDILQWLANNDHFVEASGMFFGHVPGANNGKLTRVLFCRHRLVTRYIIPGRFVRMWMTYSWVMFFCFRSRTDQSTPPPMCGRT